MYANSKWSYHYRSGNTRRLSAHFSSHTMNSTASNVTRFAFSTRSIFLWQKAHSPGRPSPSPLLRSDSRFRPTPDRGEGRQRDQDARKSDVAPVPAFDPCRALVAKGIHRPSLHGKGHAECKTPESPTVTAVPARVSAVSSPPAAVFWSPRRKQNPVGGISRLQAHIAEPASQDALYRPRKADSQPKRRDRGHNPPPGTCFPSNLPRPRQRHIPIIA